MAKPDWDAGEAIAHEHMAHWSADGPGGVVLGFDADGIAFTATAGHSRAGGAPIDEHSVFRWASVTKHVFAACLLESDVISPGMSLGEVLPELAPEPSAVTVAQALAMQGGLPDTRETLTLLGFLSHDHSNSIALFDWLSRLNRLNAQPGTEVSYSNAGYRYLEIALARRGVVFGDWVQSQAQRLGTKMRASEYWTDPVPGLVSGHIPVNGGWAEGFQGMHLSAAGSLSGSAVDLATWLADLLPRKVFARMARPLPLSSGEETGYGFGLILNRIGSALFPGHSGALAGYRTSFLVCPHSRAGIIALTNREDGDANGLVKRVWAGLMGLQQDLRPLSPDWAPLGLYAAPEGDLWAELRPGSIIIRGAEEQLFAGPDGMAFSTSPQLCVQLRYRQGGLTGTMFHHPVSLRPVTSVSADHDLSGHWSCDGAEFRITDNIVHWGIGPRAEKSELQPLGNKRWLFDASGARICLQLLSPNRVRLSLARSRVVEYMRRE